MRGLGVVAVALVLIGAGFVVLGSVPSAAARLFPAGTSSCPPSGPVSSGFGPAPFGIPSGPLQTVVLVGGLNPSVTPSAQSQATPVATANVSVSAGDLLVVTAEAVNFAKGSYGGINGSGEPVLSVSDSLGSFFWIGNYSGHIVFAGHLDTQAPAGALGADENITWATWLGTAGGGGRDTVTVTLQNPAPDTSLGYPGFATPQVLVTAYPAGYDAIVGGWQDFWNPSFNPSSTHPNANVSTYGQCADLLAEGFAVDGFPDTWSVPSSSVNFGRDTNYTPVDGVTGAPAGYQLQTDGYMGIYNDVRITDGPIPAAETFNAWSSWTAGSAAPTFVGFTLPSTSEEDGFQLIAVGPNLAPYGLGGSPNGCASETLSWTNPAPPFGESLVNDTVYLYSSTDTLVQVVSTDGPATGTTVTGLVCGAQYWFQVQPWYSAGIPGPLSGALSFIAGQFAGTAIGPASAAGFLGLGLTDWIGIAAVVAAGALVAVALTMHRGQHGGGKVGR